MAKAPRLKLDRNLIIWIVALLFLIFLGLLFMWRGPDLGQHQIDERQKEKALQQAAQSLKARIEDPANATDAALAKAQGQKPARSVVAASSPVPSMPPLPSNMAIQDQARLMQLEQYKRTLEAIERRKGAKSETPAQKVASSNSSEAGNAGFVLYSSDKAGRENGPGGRVPGPLTGAVPLYKPGTPAKPASRPVQAEQQTANTAPAAAESAPLAANHNAQVRVANAQMMAQRANGRYWLAPGTAINAVLLNAVNTLLPGSLTARVTQNIYDSRYGTHLVIPAGSILRGKYDSSVQDGQNRVFMAFDTLVTPSGGVVNLGNMSAADALGRSGMAGDLHTHFWERIGISTLLALEAVGMDRLSPNQSSASFGATTTSPATDGAQIIANTANQELQRRYSVKPNITIDAGQPLTIVTTGSIEVPPIANTR